MASDGRLLAVDPYPRGRLGFSVQRYIAQREVATVSNGRVEWVRLTGIEAAAQYPETDFEFIFIDGDHSYDGLRQDWEAWSVKTVIGGIIALHDSRPTPERPIQEAGSVRYTHDVILRNPEWTAIASVDTLTVLQRVRLRPTK
jgi:hypothetical protein